MNTFVDTHTHLYLDEFDADREQVIKDALSAGVGKMILPNVDLQTVGPLDALIKSHPAVFFSAFGLHPTSVSHDWQDVMAQIKQIINAKPEHMKAVGEVGIDLYWSRDYEEQQMQVFETQVQLAAKMNLPVIIHCREGLSQCLEVLRGAPSVNAVFHCFGGTASDVEKVRSVGDYFFGIGGVVTFKNGNLAGAVNEITPRRIVLETDAPYLAPVPFRGKRNQSAYIPLIAAKVAEIANCTLAQISDITTKNANTLFDLS